MKKLFYVAGIILLLYYMKVPNVVTFVNQISDLLWTIISYTVDEVTHVRDRHPYLYIFIPFVMLYLMRPVED